MRRVSQILGLVTGFALLLVLTNPIGIAQNALTVCPRGCEFAKIQDAIDAATAGDTISVQPGIYRENLRVTKSLILQGANAASVVMSDGTAPTIDIAGDPSAPLQVTIEGFTIVGALNPQPTDVGIQSRFARVTIARNTIASNTGAGITLGSSVFGRIQIEGNAISHNGGDGLFIRGGNRVFIFSNLIASNGQDGIRLDPSPSADIFLMDNRIREQKLWGIGGLIKACHPESADAKETLVGSIRGQDNEIPDKSEVGGNQRGAVCPESLRFLKSKI